MMRAANGAAEEARTVASVIITQLSQIAERLEEQTTRDQFIYVQQTAIISAAGDVEINIGPIRNGVLWIVERYAVTCGAGGTVAFYLDEIQPQNLVEVESNATLAAEDTDIYVPSGRNLIAHFYGAAIGSACTVNLRVKEIVTSE